MTETRIPQDGHPDEARLLAGLDEPEAAGDAAGMREHLAGCAACRRRAEELRGLLATLAEPPAMPSPAAFAAQRERILAGLPERDGAGRAAIAWGWRAWAVPVLAAAAAAALLLFGPQRRDDAPRTRGPFVDARAAVEGTVPLEVVAAAQAAADEVFDLAAGGVTVSGGSGLDPEAAETLAALDATALAEPADEVPAFAELELEFAALPDEDQSAILDELQTMTFEL